ncbi:hypothetical protein BMS3Bbin15_00401 [archaeon BMS3Bbin15]|nr:hypothetical protein BMS3Bbin15_00401 [archaeon BMS3Bbin15]
MGYVGYGKFRSQYSAFATNMSVKEREREQGNLDKESFEEEVKFGTTQEKEVNLNETKNLLFTSEILL